MSDFQLLEKGIKYLNVEKITSKTYFLIGQRQKNLHQRRYKNKKKWIFMMNLIMFQASNFLFDCEAIQSAQNKLNFLSKPKIKRKKFVQISVLLNFFDVKKTFEKRFDYLLVICICIRETSITIKF